jgi:predicted DNA-binding protein
MSPDTLGPKRMGQVSLPESQWEALKALEVRHERPRSWFVRKALEAFLPQLEESAEVAR